MAYNLRNRNFLKILDFSPKELNYLLDLARDLKRAKYTGTEQPTLLKWVLRTRVLMLPIWVPLAARLA